MELKRPNDNLSAYIGEVKGSQVEHWSYQTPGNNLIVGVEVRCFRREDGDLDTFVMRLYEKEINSLGAEPMLTPVFGKSEGQLRWEGKFIAPLHHAIVGMEIQKLRQEDGDVDSYQFRFRYARITQLAQRLWSQWIGPTLGQPETASTPWWQETPVGCVAVGLDAQRYREENRDYDSYRFGLRYGEVVP